MNDSDLFAKASKAGYDYRELYGKFPDKIGIHVRQLGLLPYSIFFPVLPPLDLVSTLRAIDDISQAASITINRHETRFEPVLGEDIHIDEVYMPMPGIEQGILSSERLAKMAKEFSYD